MKTAATLLPFCLFVAISSTQAQTINQWKDPSTGSTIFSDQAPPPGAKSVRRGGSAETDEGGPRSYATRIAAEKFPVQIYTSADCLEQCAKGRELLNGRGVPFAEKLVQGEGAELAELKALTGGEAIIPFILVGKQQFKGFDPASWNNLLDLAGYPKVAPPGSKPSGAFAK